MHGDIGMGLIVAFLVCRWLGIEETWIHVLVGLTGALWLDLDGIYEQWVNGKIAAHAGNPRDHRDGLHYPLATLIAGTLVLWLALGYVCAVIFGTATFLHFVHDSFGVGWGIKWFWPFSNRSYKFFTDKENEYGRKNSPTRFVVSWNPRELQWAIIRYGVAEWFPLYLRSWFCFGEFVVFVCGVILTLTHFFGK